MQSHAGRVRPYALAALLFLASAPTALADEECPFTTTSVVPVEGVHAGIVVEERECDDVDSVSVSVIDPSGRTTLEWYDDERGRGLEAFRPPYLVSWTDTDQGCLMVLYVFALGAIERDCVAGSPPEPVHLP